MFDQEDTIEEVPDKETGTSLARKRLEDRRKVLNLSGGDALRGNTRTHPEHDG